MHPAVVEKSQPWAERIPIPDFGIDVRLEQRRFIGFAEQHIRIEIPIRSVERDMPQEIAAFHAISHHSADNARSLAQRRWYLCQLAFTAFDEISVIAGE